MSIFAKLYKKAEEAVPVGSSRHSAAIVWKGKIIGVGINKKKTHPMMIKYGDKPHKVYLHAEIDAIIHAINKHGSEILKESSLYVVRTNRKGAPMNSKPCNCCQKAIEAFGIKEVFHS